MYRAFFIIMVPVIFVALGYVLSCDLWELRPGISDFLSPERFFSAQFYGRRVNRTRLMREISSFGFEVMLREDSNL